MDRIITVMAGDNNYPSTDVYRSILTCIALQYGSILHHT